jgi:hypothetical protein
MAAGARSNVWNVERILHECEEEIAKGTDALAMSTRLACATKPEICIRSPITWTPSLRERQRDVVARLEALLSDPNKTAASIAALSQIASDVEAAQLATGHPDLKRLKALRLKVTFLNPWGTEAAKLRETIMFRCDELQMSAPPTPAEDAHQRATLKRLRSDMEELSNQPTTINRTRALQRLKGDAGDLQHRMMAGPAAALDVREAAATLEAQASKLMTADRAADVCCVCLEAVHEEQEDYVEYDKALPCGHLLHTKCAHNVLSMATGDQKSRKVAKCPLCGKEFRLHRLVGFSA